jgi:hypothetical protein
MFIQGPPEPAWNVYTKALAAKHGFRVIESQTNVMFDALFQLNAACTSTYFLFLEEDWAIAPGVKPTDVKLQLTAATDVLGTGLVHGVRLRHVRLGGDPNWALDTWGHKMGTGLGSVRADWGKGVPYAEYPCPDCYILRDLGDDPPREVRAPKCQVWKCMESPIMYCMRTASHDQWYTKGKPKYVFYTNNPMVWRRDWFTRWRNFTGGGQLERTIQASTEWSKLPGYIIARGVGLFQHHRMDRGKMVLHT